MKFVLQIVSAYLSEGVCISHIYVCIRVACVLLLLRRQVVISMYLPGENLYGHVFFFVYFFSFLYI